MSEDRSELPQEVPRFAFEERRRADRRLPAPAGVVPDDAEIDAPDD
jgi:hypothetical protein